MKLFGSQGLIFCSPGGFWIGPLGFHLCRPFVEWESQWKDSLDWVHEGGRYRAGLALVDADALATLLSDLAQAAGYCPDYFCADVVSTVEKARELISELRR